MSKYEPPNSIFNIIPYKNNIGEVVIYVSDNVNCGKI
jgi:hypothetical protein